MSGGFSIIPNSNTDPNVNLNNSNRELMNLSFVNIDVSTDASNNVLNIASLNNNTTFHDLTLSSGTGSVSISGKCTDFSLKTIKFTAPSEILKTPLELGIELIGASPTIKIIDPNKFKNGFKLIMIEASMGLNKLEPYDNVTVNGGLYNVSDITNFQYYNNDSFYSLQNNIDYINPNVAVDDVLTFRGINFAPDKVYINTYLLDIDGYLYEDSHGSYRPAVNHNGLSITFNYETTFEVFNISSAGIYSTSDVITLSSDTLNIDCSDFTAGVADVIFSVKSTLSTLAEILIKVEESTFHFTAVQNDVLIIKLRLLSSSGITAFILN